MVGVNVENQARVSFTLTCNDKWQNTIGNSIDEPCERDSNDAATDDSEMPEQRCLDVRESVGTSTLAPQLYLLRHKRIL